MKAVLCPVCQGSGKYLGKQCHGCSGKGWVTISEDSTPYYPYVPHPYPYIPITPTAPYPYYDSPVWTYNTTSTTDAVYSTVGNAL